MKGIKVIQTKTWKVWKWNDITVFPLAEYPLWIISAINKAYSFYFLGSVLRKIIAFIYVVFVSLIAISLIIMIFKEVVEINW